MFKWLDKVPATDDFGRVILREFIDGQTKLGKWALMTPESYEEHGVGLGKGKGQHYKLNKRGDWVKVAG